MYLGKCIEKCDKRELFANPLHPYTQALLSAIPIPDIHHRKDMDVIKGEVVSPVNPKPGCRLAPRCPYATEACMQEDVPLREVSPNHFVACTCLL